MKHKTLDATAKAKMILSLGYNRFQQIDACLGWLKSFIGVNDLIRIEFSPYKKYFRFPFPIQPSSCLIEIDDLRTPPTFVITTQQMSYIELSRIYSSSNIELLELQTRHDDKNDRPLRFGLNQEEKKFVLEVARITLTTLLKDNRNTVFEDFNFPSRFYSKTNVVISLWLGNGIRGARLSRNSHLGKGIIDATIAAAKDPRFKHVKKEEIDLIRIQATLFNSLRVPLTRDEIRKNIIYRHLGYEMYFGDRAGVFLPHVLRLRPPKDLHAYLSHLAQEKVGIPDDLYNIYKTQVFTFGVNDFIEDEELNPVPFLV